jgi:hypothetical protein
MHLSNSYEYRCFADADFLGDGLEGGAGVALKFAEDPEVGIVEARHLVCMCGVIRFRIWLHNRIRIHKGSLINENAFYPPN